MNAVKVSVSIGNVVENKHFGCHILLHTQSHYGSNPQLLKTFVGLSFELKGKYDWYFRYLVALYQIKYPKQFVEIRHFNEPFIPPIDLQIKRLKDKVTAKKSLITQCENRITKVELEWDFIFPIQEDERYKEAIAKIELMHLELADMKKQLSLLKNQQNGRK